MKRISAVIAVLALMGCFCLPASAQEGATVQECYDMAIKASFLLQQLGEEGLAAFNDPQGEFVWKDSYVFVTDCSQGLMVGHPSPKVRGLDSSAVKCQKTSRLILKESCELVQQGQAQKQGVWVEYWWGKPGSEGLFRKLTFILPVSGTSYQVGAGVYNDTLSVEDLNQSLK